MHRAVSPADLPVAILAGGLSTRLRPITEKIPKLLVEVAGEPFFSHQLRLLKKSGLTRLVLCVGHLGEEIVQQYGNGSAWGVRITYSFDGPKLLGTGGALIRARALLGEAFYVLYGDSYLPIDYLACGEAFLRCGRQGLMTVYENRQLYDASNVWFADGQIRAYDKKNKLSQMRHIDFGLGLLRTQALDKWPVDAVVDLADIYQKLLAEKQLAAYEVKSRFFEIGSPAGLWELDHLLRTAGNSQ